MTIIDESKFLKPGIDTKIEGSENWYMITRVKALGLQVCTSMPPDNVGELAKLSIQLNKDYPCGTTDGWVIYLESGINAPVECSDRKGRYHYIFDA